MGFRFWRRIGVASGVALNLSRAIPSVSLGKRGAKFTASPRGNRMTFGITGTGLFYTKKLGSKGPRSTKGSRQKELSLHQPAGRPEDRLTLGFFQSLFTPSEEKALVEGCRELVRGDDDEALVHLRRATHLADGAFLAGFLALKKERLPEATEHLGSAVDSARELGRYFGKYGFSATLSLPITDEVMAEIEPNVRGALLGLVEAYQRQKQWSDALACLQRLLKLEPQDVVVRLSIVELLMDIQPANEKTCQQVARLGEGFQNESAVHAALLLYRAKALHRLGLLDAARSVLTVALRRKKDRPPDLLHALRYERALVYDELGQHKRSRTELEKLYVEAPDYEDVRDRLGLG